MSSIEFNTSISAPVNSAPGVASVTPYEQRLNEDRGWALSEGSLFFEGQGKVQEALKRITGRLNELAIPYAVVGGMALFQHGYRRFTEDVDILVTRESLKKIHEHLEGLGYVPLFAGSKNLRDTDAGVKIEFLITGQFPGDGKPKPVAFPDPKEVAVNLAGVQVAGLAALMELKLASGMTGAGRRKDLGDAQELIKFFDLPMDFAEQLNPYVREIFGELWSDAKRASADGES
ncbi:MAG TPA: nucleotidyltransferase family protein [Pirellulales bacterium]